MNEGILVPSSNRGRYAIGSPDGPDLTSGQPCEIYLGGSWIAGHIEHAAGLYIDPDLPYKAHRGYYFVTLSVGVCGLCCGMRIRLLKESL